MNVVRPLFKIALIFLCGLCFSSCSDDDGSASFNAINLSPDIGPIDVFDNDEILFSSIGYREASERTTMNTDSHEIKVTLQDSFTTLFDRNVNFRDGSDYTLFVFDFGDDVSVVLDLDDSPDPTSGRSKLRFVHGSPTVDSVDVYITGPSQPITNAIPTFDGTNFKKITNYVDSDEGNYRVRVTEKNSPVVIADSGVFITSSGDSFTVLFADKKKVTRG